MNGLNVPDSLAYGGWGGRFKMERTAGIRGMDFIEKSGKSEKIYDPYFMHASTSEGIAAINKWRQHILNDLLRECVGLLQINFRMLTIIRSLSLRMIQHLIF